MNALESHSIQDTDTLSLIYLPNQARSAVQSPSIEVTEQTQSPVEVTESPSEANNSLYCYNCVSKMSLLFMNLHNIPFKREHYIDLTVITFSTCILNKRVSSISKCISYFSYLKENTHLGMITFVHIVFGKTLRLFGEH